MHSSLSWSRRRSRVQVEVEGSTTRSADPALPRRRQPPTPTRPPPRRSSICPRRRERRAASGKALKPWIEVALPHPDVIANRFKEAEFAADLFAVDAGHAEGRLCDADAVLPHHLPDRRLEARPDHSLQRLAGRAAIR